MTTLQLLLKRGPTTKVNKSDRKRFFGLRRKEGEIGDVGSKPAAVTVAGYKHLNL